MNSFESERFYKRMLLNQNTTYRKVVVLLNSERAQFLSEYSNYFQAAKMWHMEIIHNTFPGLSLLRSNVEKQKCNHGYAVAVLIAFLIY